MGMDLELYVGPYIKILKKKIFEKDIEAGCIDKQCSKRKKATSAKYCPECGSKIQKYEITTLKKVDWFDISEKHKIEDSFFDATSNEFDDNKHIVLIPNQNKYIPKNWKKKSGDEFYLVDDLDPSYITKDLNDFPKLAEKVITILNSEFGQENVSIHWGILQYYM